MDYGRGKNYGSERTQNYNGVIMLDSINKILEADDIDSPYKSLNRLKQKKRRVSLRVKIIIFILVHVGVIFVPWTQNIRVPGKVTTLYPDQRPQSVPAAIDGRIEAWYKKEGDRVAKGDTIIKLSEVKTEYLDPEILNRIEEQIAAKRQTIIAYEEKTIALEKQLDVFERQRVIKLRENENKIKMANLKLEADSAELRAQQLQFAIADTQFKRIQILYRDGLRSLSDYESRAAKFQQNRAKQTVSQSKFEAALAEIRLAKLQQSVIEVDFAEKVNKTRSDLQETFSKLYKERGELSKLINKKASMEERQEFYAIRAPQDGFITRSIRSGIGEIIKEGAEVVRIMPSDIDIGVEMYVKPVNMPLIKEGRPVQVVFDGWPALVVSGWPGAAIGSYPGTIWATDRSPRADGTYRILIEPNNKKEPWPEFLAMGSGAEAIAMFKTVPLGYEIWRILNGFPPEYYQAPEQSGAQK